MPPTLILIRHAQALHNVDKQYDIPDPDLSPLGIEQLPLLKETLKQHPLAKDVGVIITSPMRRTIQTAVGSLDWLIAGGITLEADARWQENSAKPCDTGTRAERLGTEFPEVDFNSLDPVYPDKTTPAGAAYAFTKSALLARGQAALGALYDRKEKAVVVVSHSGFLRAAVSGCWFFNADYRIFDFAEDSGPEKGFQLREREETKKNGGGLGSSRKDMVPLGYGLPDETPEKVA